MKEVMAIPDNKTIASAYREALEDFIKSGFLMAVMDEQEQLDRFSYGFKLKRKSFSAELVGNNLRAAISKYGFPIKISKRGNDIYFQRIAKTIY